MAGYGHRVMAIKAAAREERLADERRTAWREQQRDEHEDRIARMRGDDDR
jgi:hypothetical protein